MNMGISILLMINGFVYIWLGYNVFFKKKYHRINHYYDNRRLLRNPEKFARRVGLIQMLGGVALMIVSGVAMFLQNDRISLVSIVLGNAVIGLSLFFNFVFTKKPF